MFQIKEDYLIHIVSNQKTEDGDDEIAIKTLGDFTEIGNKKYITYKEYDEENPENYKLSIIKLEESGLVTLIKNGEGQSKLILEKGKRHHSPYYTDFGMLMLGVFTNNIDFHFSEGKGELKIKYSMDINSSFVSVNEVTVGIQKIDKQSKGETNV